jgi:hypothetical protein
VHQEDQGAVGAQRAEPQAQVARAQPAKDMQVAVALMVVMVLGLAAEAVGQALWAAQRLPEQVEMVAPESRHQLRERVSAEPVAAAAAHLQAQHAASGQTEAEAPRPMPMASRVRQIPAAAAVGVIMFQAAISQGATAAPASSSCPFLPYTQRPFQAG